MAIEDLKSLILAMIAIVEVILALNIDTLNQRIRVAIAEDMT